MALSADTQAPAFTQPNSHGEIRNLSDYGGKWLVLYFYPKDSTPGCTVEANEFTASKNEFESLGATIVGVSPDSCKRHLNFIEKQGLEIELLSDPDTQMLESYDVWKEKSMYGKTFMGVVRTTYLIDPNGKITHVWPKVKVKGHVEAVLAQLKELVTA